MGTGKQMSLSISSDQGLALSSLMARVHSVGEIQHRRKLLWKKEVGGHVKVTGKTELLLLVLFQKKV